MKPGAAAGSGPAHPSCPRVSVKRPFRFEKKERIARSGDFRRVMKTGRRRASQSFILFTQKNELRFHRLGIVVKKEIGPAIFRNRTKRYVREFFRLHKDQIKGTLDIVLLTKKGCLFKRYSEVEGELRRLFIL